jgi:hypothetical protein
MTLHLPHTQGAKGTKNFKGRKERRREGNMEGISGILLCGSLLLKEFLKETACVFITDGRMTHVT